MVENLIKFETAPRPMVEGRSKIPYEEIFKSLQALDSTKSLVFKEKEMSNDRVYQIRAKARKLNLPYVRVAKQNGKVYMWMHID